MGSLSKQDKEESLIKSEQSRKMNYFLFISAWLAAVVEGATWVEEMACGGLMGTKTTRNEWDCGWNGAECTTITEDCSDCTSMKGFRQTDAFTFQRWDGLGGEWCTSKCDISLSGGTSAMETSDCSRTQTPTRPDVVIFDDCEYRCKFGGCEVEYIGEFRSGETKGSCFPLSFSGGCSGIPDECIQDCHTVLDCA